MQEKVKATWVIAVILIGVLSVLSYFPSGDSTAEVLPSSVTIQDQLGTLMNDEINAEGNTVAN
ncbi:MAG: hypothetical protein JJ879_16410 [Sneathiella sp.]|nr:hypothetical protein [Sneathiella sp.]